MTGAELICKMLKDEGVEYVFGVPGNTEIPLLDALASKKGIRYISAVHESVSIAMADGYARASGKVGVVLVHTAPGTANIIGNLYNAHDAGTPLVVLAGQQDSRLQWSDPLLDTDLLTMVSQHTKERWWVGRAQDIPKAVMRAFKEATTFPTGPVFLAIPRDLQSQDVELDISSIQSQRVPMSIRSDKESLSSAARLLAKSEQPAILAGHLIPDVDAMSELMELAEALDAPVFTTGLVPKLIFPTNHPLYFGRVPPIGFGLPGLESFPDVLLAVGSHLFKQLFYIEGPLIPPTTKLIQIDLDPRGLGKDSPATVALFANPKTALAELTSEVKRLTSPSIRHKRRRRMEQLRKAQEQAKIEQSEAFAKEWNAFPIKPSRAIQEIANALPKNGVVVDEAVMLTSYVAAIMEFSQPGSYFCSIACLGWGLPAALGVALGNPERHVLALLGDGCTLFGLQALWTAAKYQIPVTIVVLNNRSYAAIKWGFASYPDRKSPDGADLGYDLGNVDFPKLAQSFGISGQRIEKPGEIAPALRKAFKTRRPILLDIMVDPGDVGYGMPRLS